MPYFSVCIISICLMLLLAGCREPDNIGEDLLPGATVGQNNSIPVVLKTRVSDTANTNFALYYLVGDWNDPVFGHIRSRNFTTLQLSAAAPSFPADYVLDSVLLDMAIITAYGDAEASPLAFSVHELAEALDPNRTYYSHDSVSTTGPDLANGYVLNPQIGLDSIQRVQLRIPLDAALGHKVLAAPASALASNDAFSDFFKGVAISARRQNPGDQGIIYSFNPFTSAVVIKYHSATDTTVRTFGLVVSVGTQGFNQYARTQAVSLPISLVPALAPENQTHLFLQAGTTTRIDVKIDPAALAALGPLALNRAVLELSLDPAHSAFAQHQATSGPSVLTLRPLRADGLTEDSLAPALELRTAALNRTTGLYQIDITSYVQRILLQNQENHGFVIILPRRNVSFDRAVLGGMAHPNPELRPRFRLFYTQLPE